MTMPVPVELDTRGRRLHAALTAVLLRHNAPELRLVHEWLDPSAGLGLVVAGMTRHGWDVQLTAYTAYDWRANFFPVGDRSLDRWRISMGADAVAGGAEDGVGGAQHPLGRVLLGPLGAILPPAATRGDRVGGREVGVGGAQHPLERVLLGLVGVIRPAAVTRCDSVGVGEQFSPRIPV